MIDGQKVYDLLIAGAGPAGISAAIYGTRKGMKLVVITEDVGGQTNWSGDIENYTGFQMIKGSELVAKFEEHLDKYDIHLREQETLRSLSRREGLVEVVTSSDTYTARSVIVATGKTYKKLRVPGEDEFQRKGIAYCATCDAPFFAGKVVAVVGGGNSAFESAEQLVKIVEKLYIIDMAKEPVADKILQDKVFSYQNVEMLGGTVIKRITGDSFVSGIEIETGQSERHLEVGGVFVEIGLVPNSSFQSDLKKNEQGEIAVDNSNATNIEGVFAAGDVTNVPHKQIIIAAGEGAKAAISSYTYVTHKT